MRDGAKKLDRRISLFCGPVALLVFLCLFSVLAVPAQNPTPSHGPASTASVESAREAARRGEFGLIDSLRRLLAAPYDEHPGWERFAEPPTLAAREIEVSCSS